RTQTERATSTDIPILQSDARSNLLLLSFRSGTALDKLVEEAREDETSKELNMRRLLRAARPMFWLAPPPSLLPLFDRWRHQGVSTSRRPAVVRLVLFGLSRLEWQWVALALPTLDEMSGGGEEGNRAFYLYPPIHLPRLLPLIGALVVVLLGVPILPVL